MHRTDWAGDLGWQAPGGKVSARIVSSQVSPDPPDSLLFIKGRSHCFPQDLLLGRAETGSPTEGWLPWPHTPRPSQ